LQHDRRLGKQNQLATWDAFLATTLSAIRKDFERWKAMLENLGGIVDA
jgi:hypothetical protein